MPRIRAVVSFKLDGREVRRFPITRSLDAAVVEDLDIQKNINALSALSPPYAVPLSPPPELADFEDLLEDKRLGDVTALLLQPDSTMTVRLAGQSDAGIVLGPGALMLLFNVKICPPLVLVSDANAISGRLRGLVAGTEYVAPPVLVCPTMTLDDLVVTFIQPPPADVTIVNYHWDFGDGTSADTGATNTVVHTYEAPGTYAVTVTATTDDGCFISKTCPLSIALSLDCPTTEANFLSVDFTITPPVGADVANYLWDFGDGTTLSTGATPTAHHNYAAGGTYAVVVIATLVGGSTAITSGCPIVVEEPELVLQVDEEWEWQFTDGILQVDEEWEWSDPPIGDQQVGEEWES